MMKRALVGTAAAGLAVAAALGIGVTNSALADSTGRSVQSTQADSTWGVTTPDPAPTPTPEVTLADSTWG
ncbi:hypothetical protein ACIG0C_36320 [Kitasatospora aureofaciens]|uniref:hypothetical protein n=1 Tax=Kitasatospora aureofaciens TaxID=1894 RepID=UPI0037CB3582